MHLALHARRALLLFGAQLFLERASLIETISVWKLPLSASQLGEVVFYISTELRVLGGLMSPLECVMRVSFDMQNVNR